MTANPLNIVYEYNDCGVITNPFLLWHYKPPKGLAWLFWEIKIGKCENGLWDFGYWTVGGCSPCSFGRFEDYNQAEKEAIEYFNKYFKNYNPDGMCNEQAFNLGKQNFQLFLNNHYFKNKTIELQDFDVNAKDYIQGSLF